MRTSDRVDVSGEVQVEFLHWDDLTVATAGRTTLDAESRALRRLTNASEHLVAENGTERLRQSNHSRALNSSGGGTAKAA